MSCVGQGYFVSRLSALHVIVKNVGCGHVKEELTKNGGFWIDNVMRVMQG